MELILKNIRKAYDQRPVLNGINLTLRSGQTHCLMGASGSGKTTLLRMILGLEAPDEGSISGLDGHTISAVFQEDRLCETFSPMDNVMMVTGSTLSSDLVRAELCRILPEECLTRPVSTLSGGMKRRTAICRALLAPSDGILMDEPFTGLDEETKAGVIAYIKEKTAGRLLLVATHSEEDLSLLGGNLITL